MIPGLDRGFGRRALAVPLLFALSTSCGEERRVVTGALDPRAQSQLLSLAQGDLHLAMANPAEAKLELEVPEDFSEAEPILVSRVQLAQSLSELGLEAGALNSAPAPSRPVSALSSLALETALVDTAESVAFTAGSISSQLAELRVPALGRCPSFRVEPVDEGAGYSLGSLELSDGRFVVATTLGLFLLGEGPTVRFLPTPSEPLAGYSLDPSGELWLATYSRVARIDLETGSLLEEIALDPRISTSGALLVTRRDPLRAYLFTHHAEIWRLDGQAWSLHESLPRERVGREVLNRMSFRTRGGDTFIAGSEHLSVLVQFDGASYRYFQGGGLSRGFAGIGETRDGRWFVVDSFSTELYLEAPEDWERGPDLGTKIYSFATFGTDAYLYASADGVVGVFDLESGPLCPATPIANFHAVRDLVRVGDRYFVAGALGSGSEAFGWLIPE